MPALFQARIQKNIFREGMKIRAGRLVAERVYGRLVPVVL